MSDIGICKYCKHINKDIIEKPCLHCAANLGAFEFDLSEHDAKVRDDAIDDFQEWLKTRVVGIDNSTKEILVAIDNRWELAVEKYKEQKDE